LALLLSSPEELAAIVNFRQCVGVGLDGLGRRIAAELELDESTVRALLRAISRIKRFFDSHDGSVAGLKWISENMESRAPAEWRKEYEARLQRDSGLISDAIDKVSDDHPIAIALKAQTLVYSHQNIFLNAKLITDIRPVFSDDASKIDELVVTHMLTLDYTDGTQRNTVLTLAMDQDDIEVLQLQCERAARKTLTLRNELKGFQLVVMPDNLEEKQ
jgi:hypothetical protein